MKKDELIKLTLENEKLQKKLVELQREVSTVGLSKAAYAKKLQELYSEAGTELTEEEVESCAGGCRALGLLFSGGDLTGTDRSKCVFFRDGWYERITEAFAGWDSMKRIGTRKERDALIIRRMFS